MCRILAITSKIPFEISDHLRKFAEIARDSKEFQGHGWGLMYLHHDKWVDYHNLDPIWEDDVSKFPSTTRLLVHARSAFRDEGITIENNMPFHNGNRVFVFNGELRGVRIKEEGRIGAEKIFNFILRFDKYGMKEAIHKAIPIIDQRTDYIRALNFVIADDNSFFISNYYNEDPDYFNLHVGQGDDLLIISSQPYDTDVEWHLLQNKQVEEIQCY